jgi:hypothetical protein
MAVIKIPIIAYKRAINKPAARIKKIIESTA